jgi:acetyl esterase/lipase
MLNTNQDTEERRNLMHHNLLIQLITCFTLVIVPLSTWSAPLSSPSLQLKTKQQSFKNALAYHLPDMESVIVQSVEYHMDDQASLTMEIYSPSDIPKETRLPVVILVFGFPDVASRKAVGSPLKDHQQYISWGRLLAASGFIAVTYETNQPNTDLEALVAFIRKHADVLKMDATRVGIWSCSANVPTAVSFAMQNNREYVKCGVFYYDYMLTPDNQFRESINQATQSMGAYGVELQDIERLRDDLPVLVVKAGQDTIPFINESIDHFLDVARDSQVPMTVIDYPEGVHAFDIRQQNERSREIIVQPLDFMKTHLSKIK